MEKATVVIPYYHSQLTKLEKISFKQCLKILYRYPTILVVPDTMDKAEYPDGQKLIFKKVPSQWLQSISTYNRMMLNEEFYNLFCEYEYILIYQLDAFVFSDELMKFCNMGYDYIGAPWPWGVRYYKDVEHCIWDVGNGGFSLRNIKASLKMLQKNPADTWKLAEDLYWATCDSPEFHVAPIEIACQFSMERMVRRMFELNQRRLPFGCHAWAKKDFPFWKQSFEKEGYTISEDILMKDDWKMDDAYEDILKIPKEIVEKGLRKFAKREFHQIYVWGAGITGQNWTLFFRHAGLLVKCVDNNKMKWGEYLWDVCVESPDILQTAEEGALVVIAEKKYGCEIRKQLSEMEYCQEYEIYSYEEMQKFILSLQKDKSV